MSDISFLHRSMFSSKAKFYVVDNLYPEVWDEEKLWVIGPEGKVLSKDQIKPMTMDVGTFELTWAQFCGQVQEYWNTMF